MAYRKSGDWTWEFYPPPYDFLAPRDSAPQPAPIIFPGGGLSGLGCGCGCSGGCSKGMGQLDFSSVQNFVASVPTFLSEPSSVLGVTMPNWMIGAIGIGILGLVKGLGESSSAAPRRRRYSH